METLIVHPKDENQLVAIKAFMQALNIDFEKHDDYLSPELKESIDRGLFEANNGKTISFEAFKAKHFKVG